ncbi:MULTISPECIES: SAVED domain-containing protein [unclassified Corallococcus]|uniref:SAVED domain-containing protein n=1 Tax=unclassified Corallococcus TaxID=2685029 RepID=UPI001A8C0E71|nr:MULTISPECIES: SAVED domain-containing protein [unclassified Corallococcus]MBN9686154.1 SAVED domain-containing protein [Corallococcus sp. NCSPR001]WAS82414.1 SAVED domain-containing protein [Corallococcus sp. NCRR]
MSPKPVPLEIKLEFTGQSKKEFAWQSRSYHARHSRGTGASIELRWSKLRKDLEALARNDPGGAHGERLSKALGDFLSPAGWALVESHIKDALHQGRPVHLTLCAAVADELYFLPWELLTIGNGPPFAETDDCVLQYEYDCEPRHEPDSRPQGRILFAWSSAGGWVPHEEHLSALKEACAAARFDFDPDNDVLPDATAQLLEDRIRQSSRPFTALHLLSHGKNLGDGTYGLELNAFEPTEGAETVNARRLGTLLFAKANSLRLITLSACQSGDSGAPAHPMRSIAQMLHTNGAPAVIASRFPLSCPGSIVLARTLYTRLLVDGANLGAALSATRRRLRETDCYRDSRSLQLYARAGDEPALYPFSPPPRRPSGAEAREELVRVCHEALTRTSVEPHEEDAPELFARRNIRPGIVLIDQYEAIGERQWENLEQEVQRLAAPKGLLRSTFNERGTAILYYGFPYVPLALLSGYLANNRLVHVVEHDRSLQRFTWSTQPPGSSPRLEVTCDSRKSGCAARVRISVSNEVEVKDCAEVLPESEVRLDLHLQLKLPQKGIVQSEAQVLEYAKVIRDAIEVNVSGRNEFKSVHVFAAVPVSIAFHVGRALASTGLPECYSYNYNGKDIPRYRWRLALTAAKEGRPSVTLLNPVSQESETRHG